MKADRPLIRFADNQHDEWTTRADLEAGRWLRAGYHPNQLDPAKGIPLEGALDRVDADGDPSVAETALRSSEEALNRVRRKHLAGAAVAAASVIAAIVGAIWVWG